MSLRLFGAIYFIRSILSYEHTFVNKNIPVNDFFIDSPHFALLNWGAFLF
jgi:hypothetical protein